MSTITSGNIVGDLLSTLSRVVVPDNAHLELEVRYIIDDRKIDSLPRTTRRYNKLDTITIAKNVIHHVIKQGIRCEIEQTINLMKDNIIRQMHFVNGVQNKDKLTFYSKQRIINPLLFLGDHISPAFKFSASFEHKGKKITINADECTDARVRLRFSAWISDHWRLDITLVKNVKLNNPLDLKMAKNDMLFDINIKTFVSRAPWSLADVIEFEMEYIGEHTALSIDDLRAINRYMDDFMPDDQHSDTDKNNTGKGIDKAYQEVIYNIAKILKPNQAMRFKRDFGMRQLSNQVIELDKNVYIRDVLPNIDNFYITDKVDGKRTLIYIKDADHVYAINHELQDIKADLPRHTTSYIFDCEMYEQNSAVVYYVFDVMVWNGVTIINKPFHERLKYIQDAVQLLPTVLKDKPFIRLNKPEFRRQIKTFKANKKPYDVDGIILTPADGQYVHMQVYKYKPLSHLSVDFLIKKCPPSLLGIEPYNLIKEQTLYLLFSGISVNVLQNLNIKLIKSYEELFPNINTHHLPKYLPIQFEPSNKTMAHLYYTDDTNIDGNVGEFQYDTTTNKWKMIKLRNDRQVEVARGIYFGNDYKVAEMTWLNYFNPLNIEDDDSDDSVYFQHADNPLHKASRSYNSYVKSMIFNQFKDTPKVLDMASGKGQDLFRYNNIGVSELLCLDIDKTALMELIARKHELSKSHNANPMKIYMHAMDLNKKYNTNIEILKEDLIIPPNGYDLIICNFAFHYLIANKDALLNICKFIHDLLRVGGRFIFTAFDGKSVINLLNADEKAPPMHVWNSAVPGKFSIKASYAGYNVAPIGQKIEVLLPFSNNEYYTEYLVNIEFIAQTFKKFNMQLEHSQSFADFLDDYKKNNKHGYDSMDDDDKTYTGLYHYNVFYKKGKILHEKDK